MKIDFTIKRGDTLPVLKFTLSDSDGPVSLRSATSLTFRMRLARGGTIKVNAIAVANPDQVNFMGQGSYSWQQGDTDTPGVYLGEVVVVFPGALQYTFPSNDANNPVIRVSDNLLTV